MRPTQCDICTVRLLSSTANRTTPRRSVCSWRPALQGHARTCFVGLARLGALSPGVLRKIGQGLLAIGASCHVCAQSLGTDSTLGLG